MASIYPIGVMDSGAGGLSVVKAIKRALPYENIHYFADTAHLPYGIKSPEFIKYLALKMARHLVALSSCKMLVVACHTISVWWLREIEQALGIPVIGMVNPSIDGLKDVIAKKPVKSVGILSTKATVNSKVYEKVWPLIDIHSQVARIEHASGPLVSLVEETDLTSSDLKIVLDYFLPQSIKMCDALLIGCTHFSALIPSLSKMLKPSCHIVDAADFVASHVHNTLGNASMLSNSDKPHKLIAYISDNKERFQIIARRFIEDELIVKELRDYARTN
jgi:glutamate racemase